MTQLRLLAVTTVTYVAITVCGCLISVFMGFTMNNFGGYCILFMDVMWVNENHFIAEFGDRTACDAITYLPVCSCIAHGTIMAIYHGYILFKALTSVNHAVTDTVWVLPWFLVNVLVAISTFVTATIVTVGFTHTCTELLAGQSTHYESCADFQSNMIWSNPIGDQIDPSTFYRNTSIAQVSSWVCTGLWMTMVAISAKRLSRQRKCKRSRAAQLSPSSSSSQEKAIIADISPTA